MPNHLVEMTLKEAIDVIAARAAERRGRPATFQEKVALELSNALSAAGDFINKNDAAKGALLGAGVGAVGGGAAGLLGPGSLKEKGKRAMGNLITGGLGGAALGGGLGAARQYGSGFKMPGTGGGSGSGGGAAKSEFTDPDSGKPMAIDPKILKARPELSSQIQSLQTPSTETRIGQGVLGVGAGALNYAPVSTIAGGAIGAKELKNALTSEGMFNKDNLHAGLAHKDMPKSLMGGQGTLDNIRGMSEATKAQLLNEARNPGLLSRLRGRGGNLDTALAGGVTRGEVQNILSQGQTARKLTSAKIPGVTGRNAAIMGLAGAADVGRHMYLGNRDDEARRETLRELMKQVAHETAAGKR